MSIWFDILCLILLILLNGFFAMSEISIVTARRSKLQMLADQGARGAELALSLSENPTRALSTIQVGITSIGILSGIVGLLTGGFDIWGWNASMGLGITNMGELIIVTLLAGGMLEMIRYNGGIDWIILKLTSRIRSTKGAEGSIAALISFANLCTANNTIALIMAGPIAKDIADRFKIDPRRSASLLDIFSCFVQGIIPYGAQLLMAAGLGHVSPIEIMQYLYYPYLLGVGALLAITFNYPRKYAGNC